MTESAARMNEVVSAVQPMLRERGFKKQRHAFAREVEGGITHSIQFVMGRHEPHPDRRPGLYGAFTVEVGVFVDAVAELAGEAKPRFVRAFDCQFRERAGVLFEGEDTWWALDQPVPDLAEGMEVLLSDVLLPCLERLSSVDGILATWHAGELGTMFAAEINVALLHLVRGDRDAAAQMFRAELGRTDVPGYAVNLVSLGQELGLDVSMDDARVVNLLAAERDQRL
jgi:hypothetical protein